MVSSHRVTQPPFCIICCQAYLAHVNCTHRVHGRLEQVLSTETCMKVVECVQIVCKLHVSIFHPAFDTLCCFLLHGVGVLEQIAAHLAHAEESAAFWRQTNKLLHRHRIQLVHEESECLAIHSAVEGMVEGVLTEIVVSCSILCHISIDIRSLNSISQTTRVREQQSQLTHGVGILRTCDCSESCTCAVMTSRARNSPHRWVYSV